MGRPTIVLELADSADHARDLSAGGVFVQDCALAINDELDLVVRGVAGELSLAARVVYVAPTGGAGLELVGFNATIKDQLEALGVEVAEAELAPAAPIGDVVQDLAPVTRAIADPDDDHDDTTALSPDNADEPAVDADTQDDSEADPARKKLALHLGERLRGLTLAQQIKTAHSSDPSTRIMLERMYGKSVWEALLRNPRLTAPEVSRIARMGALPRIQLEQIVNNGSWLQIPEVRRALLANPRLGTDQILRVLRMLPKHELKLASTGTAYPFAVRDCAKRLLKELER